jgi:hypothetical protein
LIVKHVTEKFGKWLKVKTQNYYQKLRFMFYKLLF